jgi:hypothetical protein
VNGNGEQHEVQPRDSNLRPLGNGNGGQHELQRRSPNTTPLGNENGEQHEVQLRSPNLSPRQVVNSRDDAPTQSVLSTSTKTSTARFGPRRPGELR